MARRHFYPDTPSGHARELKDAEDAHLTRLGHSMSWAWGHGVAWLAGDPGYRGRCRHCGGIARLAWLDGQVYRGYENDMERALRSGARRCRRGRS